MKKYLIALVIVILLIIIAGVVYLNLNKPTVPDQIACTMEAKICPDGVTYVGRQGPKCAFAPCPVAQASEDTSSWKTYENNKYGFEFKYPQGYKENKSMSQYGVDSFSFSDINNSNDFNICLHVSVDNDTKSGADPLTVLKFQPEKIINGPVDLVVDGVLVKKYKINWEYKDNNYIYNFAVIQRGEKVYTFSDSGLKPDEEVFDLILSTFKFTK